MASRNRVDLPLIVIVGPTASGKTDVGLRLAGKYGGEIISADSRAIFRKLDIGTAKPTQDELGGVPYWGIDLINVGDRYTVAEFKQYAIQKIEEIRSRGHVPLLVGGTGLYVDAILYDYQFPKTDISERASLNDMTTAELRDYCIENNITLPENAKNKRHLINAIFRKNAPPKRKETLIDNTIVVGISTEKEELDGRIRQRAKTIFDAGVIEEARKAADQYGWEGEAMTGNIYPLIHQYLSGQLTRDEMIERFIYSDIHLAKRQLTWFRRNKDIVWLSRDDTYKYVAHELEKLNNS